MIRYDNKELNINWHCDTNPIVYERDLNLMNFKEYQSKAFIQSKEY